MSRALCPHCVLCPLTRQHTGAPTRQHTGASTCQHTGRRLLRAASLFARPGRILDLVYAQLLMLSTCLTGDYWLDLWSPRFARFIVSLVDVGVSCRQLRHPGSIYLYWLGGRRHWTNSVSALSSPNFCFNSSLLQRVVSCNGVIHAILPQCIPALVFVVRACITVQSFTFSYLFFCRDLRIATLVVFDHLCHWVLHMKWISPAIDPVSCVHALYSACTEAIEFIVAPLKFNFNE